MHDRPMTPDEQSQYEYEKAPDSMGRYVQEVSVSNKVVLDFGCGWGGETLWLKHQGAKKVYGVDVNLKSLKQAQSFSGEEVEYESDITRIESESVDYVFSTNVFEHVMDLDDQIGEIRRILVPGGALVTSFGPLFYSPYGCHFYWAGLFPWSHLIMGRKWLKRRIDRIRGNESQTSSWEDMGLNRMTFDDFAQVVSARFDIRYLEPIPVAGLPNCMSNTSPKTIYDIWV